MEHFYLNPTIVTRGRWKCWTDSNSNSFRQRLRRLVSQMVPPTCRILFPFTPIILPRGSSIHSICAMSLSDWTFSSTHGTLHVCMFTRHTESIFIGEEDKNGRADNHQVVAGSRIRRRRRNGQLQPDTSMETTPKQSVETRDTLMILVRICS